MKEITKSDFLKLNYIKRIQTLISIAKGNIKYVSDNKEAVRR